MHESLFAGPTGDWLAVLGLVSLVYWAWRILAAVIRFAQAPSEADPPPPAAAGAPPARAVAAPAGGLAADLPVIFAAVAAMFDAHRVVHIEEVPHGQVWSAQGRWMHQTSHQTH